MFDRELGMQFLLFLGDCLDRASVPFFLIQGTALGAHRDGGFTPTEKDIDIGVLYPYFSVGRILKEVCYWRGVEVNTFYRTRMDGLCHTIVVKYGSIKADLVSFQLNGDKRYAQSPSDVKPPYCIVHDKELLENYQTVEMFGRKWNVPSPIETYLEREYGPDWRTSREDHISRTRIYNYLQENGLG